MIVNGHRYYASYGRTQFVLDTFLQTLQQINRNPAIPASVKTQLGLNDPVTLPGGTAGTMGTMVNTASRRARAASDAFTNFRNTFGRGLSIAQATAAWNSLSATDRSNFTRDTGLGQTEFIDMLGFGSAGRAQSEEEGKQAFASEAVMRLLDGNGQATLRDWLLDMLRSQDRYNYVSRFHLQRSLNTILTAPALAGRFTNSEQPGTPAHRTRQRAIEGELARRIAARHNGGPGRGLDNPLRLPGYLSTYVNEFMAVTGRGDWESLRSSAELGNHGGLEMRKLEFK